jgi:ABC-type proline/glycine betaine transport system permease subunit
MKKNKYIVFASIGFELIGLLIFAIWLGNYLVEKGYGTAAQAFCVLGAFFIWFISLIMKLKSLKTPESTQDTQKYD